MFGNEMRNRIANKGYTFVGVFDPEGKDPNFVYSMGLTSRGWPELLLIGNIPMRVVEIILTDLIEKWQDDGAPYMGVIPDMIRFADGSSYALHVQEVDAANAIDKYAIQLPNFVPGKQHRVCQVLWPDADGVYPTEPGYDTAMIQPVLP